MTTLTNEAEIFLQKLREALFPLAGPDREEIILQYRCHLEDRAAQGPLHLVSCLEHLGSPARLARELLDALASGRTLARRSAPGDVVARATGLQRTGSRPRARLRFAFGILARDFAATLAFSTDEIWTARLALTSGLTGITFWEYILAAQHRAAAGHALHYAAFALLATAALVIAYRAMLSDAADMWSLDLDTLRFASAMAGVFALPPALMLAGGWLAHAASSAVSICATAGLCLAGFYVVTRVQPYLPALLLGRGPRLPAVWAKMRIWVFALATGYVTILGPLCLIHWGVARLAASRTADEIARYGLGLAAIDALAQTALVISFCVLNAMAFRWVVGEPVPLGVAADCDRRPDFTRPDGGASRERRAA